MWSFLLNPYICYCYCSWKIIFEIYLKNHLREVNIYSYFPLFFLLISCGSTCSLFLLSISFNGNHIVFKIAVCRLNFSGWSRLLDIFTQWRCLIERLHLSKNSLITLLQAIVGRRTTVDLRREDSVEGLLVNVDAFMNLTLKEVRLISAVEGRPDCFLEELFIQGREIRYVHIPDDMNIMDSIHQQLNYKKDFILKQKSELNKMTQKKIIKRQKESLKREKKELMESSITKAATAPSTST